MSTYGIFHSDFRVVFRQCHLLGDAGPLWEELGGSIINIRIRVGNDISIFLFISIYSLRYISNIDIYLAI